MTLTIEPNARLGRGRHRSRLDAVERRLMAADSIKVVDGHPLPDLTGASPVEIADALAAAVVAAHAEEWPSPLDDQSSVQLCPRCLASLNDAVTAAEANDPAAGRRQLVAVFDEVIALRHGVEPTP